MSSNNNVLLSVDEILGLVTLDGGSDGEDEDETGNQAKASPPISRLASFGAQAVSAQKDSIRKGSFPAMHRSPPIATATGAKKASRKVSMAKSMPPIATTSSIPQQLSSSSPRQLLDHLAAHPLKTAAGPKKASRFEIFEDSNQQTMSSPKTTTSGKRSSNSRFDIFQDKLREEEDTNGIIL